jgi:hypothetical protein
MDINRLNDSLAQRISRFKYFHRSTLQDGFLLCQKGRFSIKLVFLGKFYVFSREFSKNNELLSRLFDFFQGSNLVMIRLRATLGIMKIIHHFR